MYSRQGVRTQKTVEVREEGLFWHLARNLVPGKTMKQGGREQPYRQGTRMLLAFLPGSSHTGRETGLCKPLY
jgi:hypothetical protein